MCEPPHFFHLQNGAVDEHPAVYEFQGAGMGLGEKKLLLKCSQRGMEEENLGV